MFQNMLTVAIMALAFQASSIAAHPMSTLEPTSVTQLAVATGEPFEMSVATPSPVVMARQWEWTPLAPAWTPAPPAWTPSAPAWTPAPTQPTAVVPTQVWQPSPSPSYIWGETHNDDKNTLEHGIIAAIIIGAFVSIGFVGCIAVTIYRKCCGGRVKNKGKGKATARDVEAGELTAPIDMREMQSVASAENYPPTQSREFLGPISENGRRVASPPMPTSHVHYTRGQGIRPTGLNANGEL
ncbi:hypothetical protein EK21DRAFT_85643 [Setomelanomma holmii]|uniref:Uncharacterized protein n=1 Tax=Setomelanomma holmii TaxID=210430 RepID=A0A9P4LRY0_9PLEO|nr:hypothetical protein EK21DRAFT_85643 [Setomelanomma holmii]